MEGTIKTATVMLQKPYNLIETPDYGYGVQIGALNVMRINDDLGIQAIKQYPIINPLDDCGYQNTTSCISIHEYDDEEMYCMKIEDEIDMKDITAMIHRMNPETGAHRIGIQKLIDMGYKIKLPKESLQKVYLYPNEQYLLWKSDYKKKDASPFCFYGLGGASEIVYRLAEDAVFYDSLYKMRGYPLPEYRFYSQPKTKEQIDVINAQFAERLGQIRSGKITNKD